ncbi:MAG: peptidoglycan endopeptidase [Chthoniobacteraceae bacterium]
MFRLLLFAVSTVVLLAGCGGSHGHYAYHYVPGKTATVHGGHAVAPAGAPRTVKAAIEAGNRIAGLPYGYGCGHTRELSRAYDCSGATSYVLCHAGLLNEPTTSTAFRSYGAHGKGRWITVCARSGHVFLIVAGLRFDTGWGSGAEGPKWTTNGRPMNGAVVRHPHGL